MGLISGLLTLPLAPVRGTVWLAETIQAQAEHEANDEPALMESLLELDAAKEQGLLTEAQAEEAENELLSRLMQTRGFV
jgi:hypothetical protein